MASRHVLTVNQVLEIMLSWLVNNDWQKAFMEIIPQRKLPELAKQILEEGDDRVNEAENPSDVEGENSDTVVRT
jgi:tRNA (guanine9-N1)-methyltransferase